MSEQRPIQVWLRASGELACFSRPEFSVERTSYPWITPSAARGIFEAVFWKPRIRYEIFQIRVLKPIRFISIRRNEIESRIPNRDPKPTDRRDCDKDRQQRTTTALASVEYVLGANLFLNDAIPAKDANDNHASYADQFKRRIQGGKCFSQPFLGCREFAADVQPATGTETALPIDFDHGLMLYDMLFPVTYGGQQEHRQWIAGQKPIPLWFKANLRQGIVDVEPRAKILEQVPENVRQRLTQTVSAPVRGRKKAL